MTLADNPESDECSMPSHYLVVWKPSKSLYLGCMHLLHDAYVALHDQQMALLEKLLLSVGPDLTLSVGHGLSMQQLEDVLHCIQLQLCAQAVNDLKRNSIACLESMVSLMHEFPFLFLKEVGI